VKGEKGRKKSQANEETDQQPKKRSDEWGAYKCAMNVGYARKREGLRKKKQVGGGGQESQNPLMGVGYNFCLGGRSARRRDVDKKDSEAVL